MKNYLGVLRASCRIICVTTIMMFILFNFAHAEDYEIMKQEWAEYMQNSAFKDSDARLNKAFKALLNSLPPAEQTKLRDEQREWAIQREKDAFTQFSKGSPEYIQFFMAVGDSRIESLKARANSSPVQDSEVTFANISGIEGEYTYEDEGSAGILKITKSGSKYNVLIKTINKGRESTCYFEEEGVELKGNILRITAEDLFENKINLPIKIYDDQAIVPESDPISNCGMGIAMNGVYLKSMPPIPDKPLSRAEFVKELDLLKNKNAPYESYIALCNRALENNYAKGDTDYQEYIYVKLALAYGDSGNLQKAKEVITKCISGNPKTQEGYVVLSYILEREEKYKEAITAVKNAMANFGLGESFSTYGKYLNNLIVKYTALDASSTLGREGKYNEAANVLLQAISQFEGEVVGETTNEAFAKYFRGLAAQYKIEAKLVFLEQNGNKAIDFVKSLYSNDYPEDEDFPTVGKALDKYFDKPLWKVVVLDQPTAATDGSWRIVFKGIGEYNGQKARYVFLFGPVTPKEITTRTSGLSISVFINNKPADLGDAFAAAFLNQGFFSFF